MTVDWSVALSSQSPTSLAVQWRGSLRRLTKYLHFNHIRYKAQNCDTPRTMAELKVTVDKGVALWYIMYSDLHPRSNAWLTKYFLLWLLTEWIISGWPLTWQIFLISLTQTFTALLLILLTLLADMLTNSFQVGKITPNDVRSDSAKLNTAAVLRSLNLWWEISVAAGSYLITCSCQVIHS